MTDGPKPGDFDEYGRPYVEHDPTPWEHFDLPDMPEEDDEADPDHELLHDTIDPSEWEECETPERDWLLTNWIPARQMTYLTGAGSAGKSLLGQQLATCVAVGRPFLGIGTKMGRALYLTCEDDYEELHRRQKSICAGLGISLGTLHNNLHVLSLMGAVGNELATFRDDGKMTLTKAWKSLLYTVTFRKIKFIVLDNVAHLFAGNENIRNQVAGFCSLLNKLASEAGASVLLIGHPNKAGDAYSGSTAWENQVRSRLFMEVPKDEEGNFIDVDARVIRRAKANYAQNGEEIAFRWQAMCFKTDAELPKDEFDRQVKDQQQAADERRFLACLAEVTAQNRAVSELPGRNFAPNIFADMKASQRMGRNRLKAAMQRLFDDGKLERGEVGKGKDRHPIYGLKVRETAGNPLGTEARETLRETRGERGKRPTAAARETAGLSTPISLQDITGGATAGASAPPFENLDLSHLTPPDKLRPDRDPWADDDCPF